jgi:PAS domain S-box-containing protein
MLPGMIAETTLAGTFARMELGAPLHAVARSSGRDRHGMVIGLATVARALTERLTSEQQLVQAAQGYLDVAGVMVLVLNIDGTISMINPRGAGILGYDTPRDLVGKSWIDLFVPERMRATTRERFNRFVGGDESAGAVLTTLVATRAGDERLIAWYSSTLTDESGRVVALLNAGNDVTDRVRAEEQLKQTGEQLRQAQKMEAVGQLTAGIAHDFNNLLGVIILNLELLSSGANQDEQGREALRDALGAASRGTELTRGLLAFARRQALRPQYLDPNTLITKAFKFLGRVLGDTIAVSLDLAPDIWHVTVDPVQLEASITNLATNARDAMPNGGTLRITTANRDLDAEQAGAHVGGRPGAYVMIEITDTGTGMTREVLERIFEPFYTTKEEGRGTGLGLSMVFGFSRQSGGHVSVSSEPGRGTTFRLYLPRATSGAARAEVATSAAAPMGQGETILVVDDNPAMRRVVARQLVKLGYRVREADGAAAAIVQLEGGGADLLFTDVMMPGVMDGYQLASYVRAHCAKTKVVLTSGGADGRTGDAGTASAFRLLAKPYGKDDLARCMRDALDRG